jgi:hypothetical protein
MEATSKKLNVKTELYKTKNKRDPEILWTFFHPMKTSAGFSNLVRQSL